MRRPSAPLLAGVGAILLCAPFTLNATAPRGVRVKWLSAHRSQGTAPGVTIAARLVRTRAGRLEVAITAHNPSDKPTTTKVRFNAWERAPSSQFARMVPPPLNRGQAKVTLRLAPHQRLTQRVPLKTRRGRTARLQRKSYGRTRLAMVLRPQAAPARARLVARRGVRTQKAARPQNKRQAPARASRRAPDRVAAASQVQRKAL